MKKRRSGKTRKTGPGGIHLGIEALMKDFLTKLTEAAYQVAVKTGFRGSFITFLSDLQGALENVIHQDRRAVP